MATYTRGTYVLYRNARNVLKLANVNLIGVTDFYLTVKQNRFDSDNAAILQLKASEGLLRLNGAPAANPEWGSVSFSGVTVTLTLSEEASAQLKATQQALYMDIKGIDAEGPRPPAFEARLMVLNSITEALS